MHPIQRIEILADEVEMHRILDTLDPFADLSYRVLPNAQMSNHRRGSVSNDLAVTGLGEVYILVFCPPEQLATVLEAIRPILNRFGGTCYLSEVMEVRSTRCISKVTAT